MPWIRQDNLTVARQRREHGRNSLLRVAAGDDSDDISAIDGGGEIGRHALDRGEPAARAIDIDAAARADLGEAAVDEIVQTQFAAERAEFGGEIDAADAGADDRNIRVGHCCS